MISQDPTGPDVVFATRPPSRITGARHHIGAILTITFFEVLSSVGLKPIQKI